MALSDYGILLYKNDKLISKDSYDNTININNTKLSIYPKGCFVKYGDEMLFDFFDINHPYKKIIKKSKGVYFEITPINLAHIYIYIRNGNDSYKVFAGYGIDIDWKYYCKYYNYPKKILRELYKIEKK